jgi:hypothetical protein
MFFPPIHPNIRQSEKKNQKYNLYQYRNVVLLTREVAYNGKNNNTKMEHNNNITPPNLSGTDLNIA